MVRVAPCHVGYLTGTPAIRRGGHQGRLAVSGPEDSAHLIHASWHLTLPASLQNRGNKPLPFTSHPGYGTLVTAAELIKANTKRMNIQHQRVRSKGLVLVVGRPAFRVSPRLLLDLEFRSVPMVPRTGKGRLNYL